VSEICSDGRRRSDRPRCHTSPPRFFRDPALQVRSGFVSKWRLSRVNDCPLWEKLKFYNPNGVNVILNADVASHTRGCSKKFSVSVDSQAEVPYLQFEALQRVLRMSFRALIAKYIFRMKHNSTNDTNSNLATLSK